MNWMQIQRFVLVTTLSSALGLGVWIVAFNPFSQAFAQSVQAEIESTVPDKLYPCLPQQVERVEQLGQVQGEQQTFYLLGAFQGDRYWELLAQTDEAGCLLIKAQQDTEPLSAYVLIEIAQQLSLQAYQRRIEEAGGLQTFQQEFSEYMTQQQGGEIVYLAPEDVWALQQLGVEIPEGSYEIRRSNTAPNFERLPDPRSRHSQ
jgi:hypothetical protein